ncbi:hypothetical protein [Flexithrix dorotheae]|uniref:hypothetical protein n=1 Tax=Flexithrix dorotheae TaxID=70993 RepID=UPI000369473C|nr:hypothetical protein [Flexithrix dorotheae]
MKEEIIQQKKTLQKEAETYKEAIKVDVHTVVKEVENKGKKVLIISGVLLGTYAFLELFLNSRKNTTQLIESKNKKGKESIVVTEKTESLMVRKIKDHITNFILNLLTQALNEFIENLSKKRDKD